MSVVKDARTLKDAFEAQEIVGADVDNWSNGTKENNGVATIEISHRESKTNVVHGTMRAIVKDLNLFLEKIDTVNLDKDGKPVWTSLLLV